MKWSFARLRQGALALLVSQVVACQPCVSTDKPSHNRGASAGIVVRRSPPSDWIADWTLLIYAANDDFDPNLVAAFDEDALEWEHGLGGSSLFRIMVQRDYAPFQLNSENEPRESERYAIYREERHHPEEDPDPGAAEAMLLDETDTSSSTTLRDFLVYGIRTFPARHYWVTFTGHGDGFAGLAHDASAGASKRLSIAGLSAALTEASAVIATEIRTKPGYGGRGSSNRIDVVAFDACRLGAIEVAASITEAADFMIASQESMPQAGHPYSALRYIAQDHPDSTPRALVEAVVTDYVRAYVEGVSTAGRAYVGTSVTSVGLDLRRLHLLENALGALAAAVDKSHPGGFSCADVQSLLVEACNQAQVALPERESMALAGDAGDPRTNTTIAAAASVDLIALLEHLARGPTCLGTVQTNQALLGDVAKAAQQALSIIGRPKLASSHDPDGAGFQYGGQYRRIANFGPLSPFVVEAQRVDPDSKVHLGGLSVLWGNPFELLLREDGRSLYDTYQTLPFEVQTGWTRMMRTCIDEAEACRTYEPRPGEAISQGPCANF